MAHEHEPDQVARRRSQTPRARAARIESTSICPLLRAGALPSCGAVEGLGVVPTLHERERFCAVQDGFHRCPTWGGAQGVGRPLTLGEYYDNWLVTAAPPRPRTVAAR